jgi:hypothetical protein
MTDERLAEIREMIVRFPTAYALEAELVAALEAERARLNWILSHPREFRELVWDSEDESDPQLRAAIDAALAKGATR